MLWLCPKLHIYWAGVTDTLNTVFQVLIPLDPKQCLLNLLDELEWEPLTREAITRALFMARKLIMRHWISEEPPTVREWITALGSTLRMEKVIYQHRGCSGKFERLWDSWLGTPGLAPDDLVMDRILG